MLSPLAFGLVFSRVFSHVTQDIPPRKKGNVLYIANLIEQLVMYAKKLASFAPDHSAFYHILTSVDLFSQENGLRINIGKLGVCYKTI